MTANFEGPLASTVLPFFAAFAAFGLAGALEAAGFGGGGALFFKSLAVAFGASLFAGALSNAFGVAGFRGGGTGPAFEANGLGGGGGGGAGSESESASEPLTLPELLSNSKSAFWGFEEKGAAPDRTVRAISTGSVKTAEYSTAPSIGLTTVGVRQAAPTIKK